MACDLVILSIWQRCGSTLVQRMANRRKRTLVWGETGRWPRYFAGLLEVSLKFSKASQKVRKQMLADEHPTELEKLIQLANLTPDAQSCRSAVINSMRCFFESAYNPPGFDHYGFKEVLLEKAEIDLCKEAFPDASFILLIRDPVDIWRSLPDGWTQLNAWGFIKDWNQKYAHFKHAQDARSQLVFYEDIVARKPETLKLLQNLLGVRRKDIESELKIRSQSTSRERPLAEVKRIREHVGCERYRSS